MHRIVALLIPNFLAKTLYPPTPDEWADRIFLTVSLVSLELQCPSPYVVMTPFVPELCCGIGTCFQIAPDTMRYINPWETPNSFASMCLELLFGTYLRSISFTSLSESFDLPLSSPRFIGTLFWRNACCMFWRWVPGNKCDGRKQDGLLQWWHISFPDGIGPLWRNQESLLTLHTLLLNPIEPYPRLFLNPVQFQHLLLSSPGSMDRFE